MEDAGPSAPTILLLGGYGNTGKILAQLLLVHTSAKLIIAGPHLDKAKALSNSLYAKFPDSRDRMSSVQADASKYDSLVSAFSAEALQLVIVTSCTSKYLDLVVKAALQCQVDCFDIHLSSPAKAAFWDRHRDVIEHAGRCFLTDGGFHPGLPAALIRYISSSFEAVETAVVGSVIQLDWKRYCGSISEEAAAEFASEICDLQMFVFEESQWRDVSWAGMLRPLEVNFGPPFGKRPCVPMFLEELRDLPALYPTLQRTGFYVGGFNWVVDYLICPIVMVTMALCSNRAKVTMGRFLQWGLQTFSRPPYGTRLQVQATGLDAKKGRSATRTLTVSHDDGYVFTAMAVAATVLQYLAPSSNNDGSLSIRRPGVWRQALAVDPRQLLLDLQRMGVQVEPPVE